MHQYGLGDRYKQHYENGKRITKRDEGFETDMMAGGFFMNPIHFINIAKKVLELSKAKGSDNFILDVKVDNAENTN